MDQPDFVARHCEGPALGQRLKEILVVRDTSGQPGARAAAILTWDGGTSMLRRPRAYLSKVALVFGRVLGGVPGFFRMAHGLDPNVPDASL